MKTAALLTLVALTLGACTNYRPSEANCFNFMAVAPADDPCNFVALDGAISVDQLQEAAFNE